MKKVRNNVAPVKCAILPTRHRFHQRLCALLLLLAPLGGCVRTAECDATVPCDSGEVCYDYFCRSVCDETSDCDGVCSACQQNDSEGQVDHCFGAVALACLVEGTS